jgi:hypothetical protein
MAQQWHARPRSSIQKRQAPLGFTLILRLLRAKPRPTQAAAAAHLAFLLSPWSRAMGKVARRTILCAPYSILCDTDAIRSSLVSLSLSLPLRYGGLRITLFVAPRPMGPISPIARK